MTYVVIGGTGTLGSELMRQILKREPDARITCLSRDELKQQKARLEFPTVSFLLGDIRDRQALKRAFRGGGAVFHCAALKHIDSCETNPVEAIKTNLLGTINVVDVAASSNISHVVFSNTDKACLPITTYGYTKALAQNCLLHMNQTCRTRFSSFAWGNIVGSRGSVVESFARSIAETGAVSITDVRMTRFWMRIEDAARFMLTNYKIAPTDGPMIPPVKAAHVTRIAEAIARILGVSNLSINVTGLRGTEKIHEVLETSHRGCIRSDTCEQYSDAELDALLWPSVVKISGTQLAKASA